MMALAKPLRFWPTIRSRPDCALRLHPPVRVHRYQSHLIIYEIAEDDMVLILRVRHGREDWLRTDEED